MQKTIIVFFILYSLTLCQKINASEGSLSLIGCEYPQEIMAGDSFDITFYLMALEPLKKDCDMFIHLYSGKTMINADITVPYPTSKWKPNEIVKLGPFKVYVPVDTPIGEYGIEAGLFWAQETILGPRYNKLPYLNYPRIRDWEVGRLTVIEDQSEDFSKDKDKKIDIRIQDSLVKVFSERPFFLGEAKKEISLSAAKNEFESVQISIIATDEDLKDIRVVASGLSREKGKGNISKDNLKFFLVEYVTTKKPYYNTPRVGSWPDPLVPLSEPISIEKGRFKTLWLQVYIPKDTPGGRYSGKIDILSGDKTLSTIALDLRIWDFVLPDAPGLKTAFELNEGILLSYYPKKQDEGESGYQKRLEGIRQAYYLDMLKHRLNPIHNVGNPNFLGKDSNVYKLNFVDFDKRADFYLKQGQKVFSIAEGWPWQSKVRWAKWYGLKDEESVLGVFSVYGRHLEEKGWLENAYAYIFDETFFRVKEVTALIHKAHPGIKNLLTMTPNPEYKDIDIWCPRINNFEPESVKGLKSEGKEVWTYVASTTRPYPNLNLDVHSIEYRILPWICWKFNIEGLLYWAVNWWVEVNPWESAMTFPNQNGNGSLYYPGKDGPISSIRLEVLRDGMEDYVLFSLLNEKIEGLKKSAETDKFYAIIEEAEEALKLKEEIGSLLAYYTHTPNDLYQKRALVARLIEKIDSLSPYRRTMTSLTEALVGVD